MNNIFDKAKAGAAEFAANAKAAAQLTVKQAERTKIAQINLPGAYADFGKQVHAAGTYRQEFEGAFRAIDKLLEEMQTIETHATSQPKPQSIADKAKSVAGAAKDMAQSKAIQLRARQLYGELGKGVFEKHGDQAAAPQLAQPIRDLLARLASLDSEIAALSEAKSGKWLSPKHIAIGGIALVACLGLFLMGKATSGGGLGDRIKGEWNCISKSFQGTLVLESNAVRITERGKTLSGTYSSASEEACEFVVKHPQSNADMRFKARLGEDGRLVVDFPKVGDKNEETQIFERLGGRQTGANQDQAGSRESEIVDPELLRKIRIGMSMDQATAILGQPGYTESTNVPGVPEASIPPRTLISWAWNYGNDDAFIVLVFENGVVRSGESPRYKLR